MATATDGRYHFSYEEDSPYAHVMSLLQARAVPGGCVVDVGCGYGAIAQACVEAGFGYVGLDADAQAIDHLQHRGFSAAETDLRDEVRFRRDVEELLGSRPVAAITLLDTLEHLTNGVPVLGALRELATERGPVPLVVSVPNVTHLDLAAKLLLGRWDVTDTGLLDRTHVSLYDPTRLDADMTEAGWAEVAAHDYRLSWSDQHFPADAAPLAFTTPLRETLRRVRESSAPGATVNQFVRAYLPGPVPRVSPTEEEQGPFLSAVVRATGDTVDLLAETLVCLAGQDDQDFEVLIVGQNLGAEHLARARGLVADLPRDLASRVRVLSVDGGGVVRPWRVGAEEARGRYVAFLDGVLLFGHWIRTFSGLADAHPGHVLRAVAAQQDFRRSGPESVPEAITTTTTPHPVRFDLLDHLGGNRTPACSIAFPRACFRDLGVSLDEELHVGALWEMLLRAAVWCGVASAEDVTSVERRWIDDTGRVTTPLVVPPHIVELVLDRLDAAPLLLPPGSTRRLAPLVAPASAREGGREAESRLRELEGQLEEVYASTSWRVSAPVRAAGRVTSRLGRVSRRLSGSLRRPGG